MCKMNKNEVHEIVQKFNIPIAKLRILPKKLTFRPLMTFFRKSSSNYEGNKKLSLNKILNDVHIVLRNLKEKLSREFGFSVFDNDQISQKYYEFVKNWREIGKPKLYFLTMDIKKCYDSIDKNKLLLQIENSDFLVSFIFYFYL